MMQVHYACIVVTKYGYKLVKMCYTVLSEEHYVVNDSFEKQETKIQHFYFPKTADKYFPAVISLGRLAKY